MARLIGSYLRSRVCDARTYTESTPYATADLTC